jgi:S-formylglutathione hydrolase FrmB
MSAARVFWLVVLLLSIRPAWAFQTSVVAIPSDAMHASFNATVVLPDRYATDTKGARFPVIYLLHGSDGSYRDWTALSQVARLADRYKVILVMPDGAHDSWYIDSPVDSRSRYQTYVGTEVVAYVDAHYRTIAAKQGRAIAGLSMGGFGASNIALSRPDVFGAAGSMSGAVDPRAFNDDPEVARVFGDPARYAAFWDSKAIIEKAKKFADEHIALTIECGVDDTLVKTNRELHERLLALGVPHDYAERPGAHTWTYWANAVRYQVLFFAVGFRREAGNG